MSSGREARTAKRQSVPNPFPASQRTTKASTSASAGVKRRREFSPMSVSSGITLASGASSLTNDASSSTGDASTLSPLSSPSSSKCSSPAPQTACGRSKHATRKEAILKTPLPSYFQVDDLKLKPKREFNLLWYWLAERQDIYDRRRQGLPRECVELLFSTCLQLLTGILKSMDRRPASATRLVLQRVPDPRPRMPVPRARGHRKRIARTCRNLLPCPAI